MLEQLRMKKGLSQEEVAKMLGIARNTLRAIELERINPKVNYLLELSAIYDTDINILLDIYRKEDINE